MYRMDNLLTLLTIEKAKELRFKAGKPPTLVSDREEHSLEGPSINGEEVEQLFRSLANSRQMRKLRDFGETVFVYKRQGRLPFIVRAKMQDENLVFAVS